MVAAGGFRQLTDAEKLDLIERMYPSWPLEKFNEHLAQRIKSKDSRQRSSSLKKQFLLIQTGEPDLDEDTLARFLAVPFLPRPETFDAVYIMTPYMPGSNGEGRYPVFGVSFK